MAVVMGGAIAAVAVIITDGVEVEAITMVGGIIVIGDFPSRGRLSWRPLSNPIQSSESAGVRQSSLEQDRELVARALASMSIADIRQLGPGDGS